MGSIDVYGGYSYGHRLVPVVSVYDTETGMDIQLRYPQIEMSSEFGEPAAVHITGQLVPEGIKLNGGGNERKHNVYPGTITLADANGRTIEMQPTGQGGYTIHAPEPVRINSKMNETLREHATRCLSYTKPKPPAELEA